MRPTLLAVLVCAVAAALEGWAAGGGIRARFAELRLPRFSPPLAVWAGIGLGYYVICFLILRRLFSTPLANRSVQLALALLGAMMLVNAGWGFLFFRLRDLRLSFLAFTPYGILVLALAAALLCVDPPAAWILLPYLLYLMYATWWGYRLWRLNMPNSA